MIWMVDHWIVFTKSGAARNNDYTRKYQHRVHGAWRRSAYDRTFDNSEYRPGQGVISAEFLRSKKGILGYIGSLVL